jgi:hypothetical protein
VTIGLRCLAALVAALALASPVTATDIGRVKSAKGQVTVERTGASLPVAVGMRLQASDTVRTAGDGSVGITLNDDSLLSAGPNSVLVLERYAFDATTNQGRLDASLNKGTLAVISGRIAKQSPDAMTIRTPAAVLGVRGTTFVVSADE